MLFWRWRAFRGWCTSGCRERMLFWAMRWDSGKRVKQSGFWMCCRDCFVGDDFLSLLRFLHSPIGCEKVCSFFVIHCFGLIHYLLFMIWFFLVVVLLSQLFCYLSFILFVMQCFDFIHYLLFMSFYCHNFFVISFVIHFCDLIHYLLFSWSDFSVLFLFSQHLRFLSLLFIVLVLFSICCFIRCFYLVY